MSKQNKKVRMTAAEAYALSEKLYRMELGDHFFALVGYEKSDGSIEGPLMITIERGVAIEVSIEGKFKNAYTDKLDRFFPWVVSFSHKETT